MTGTGAGPQPRDPFEPPEPSGVARGIAIVVIVVVLGALILPSATRAPLTVLTSKSATSTTSTTIGVTTTTTRHPTTTTTPPPAPSTIHVLVANATTVNGVAGAVTTFLGGKGFSTLTAANAQTRLTATEIFPTSAAEVPAATEVASVLGLSQATIQSASSKPPVASSAGASVVVVAGQDLASRFAPSASTTTRG